MKFFLKSLAEIAQGLITCDLNFEKRRFKKSKNAIKKESLNGCIWSEAKPLKEYKIYGLEYVTKIY